MRLACKLLYGVQHVIEAFPRKRYFFKIDDDTVWCVPFRKHTRHCQACAHRPFALHIHTLRPRRFPRRFMSFLSTVDRVHAPDKPLYFGTVRWAFFRVSFASSLFC
jgi:hypothetical protein